MIIEIKTWPSTPPQTDSRWTLLKYVDVGVCHPPRGIMIFTPKHVQFNKLLYFVVIIVDDSHLIVAIFMSLYYLKHSLKDNLHYEVSSRRQSLNIGPSSIKNWKDQWFFVGGD